ncbi:DUF6265 family protein [Muricauda sp. 2012CJ35-5]|uniref:DUF6265 family protein n=1 Tax=Flagellimonas spongiicola TaxID=2942208 RepID=A0ABT0PT49_9FLAO|nr:DUF6265 family protein [Allomuricauda spongiicola]MCL6274563.1 DUF6265 family protein [Allomuricauda spongiicola]
MKYVILFLLFGAHSCYAQHTIQLSKDTISPNATLEDVSWIAGHWRGEALGGIAEEIWSPPMGGSMMFSFRLLHDDEVTFYEFGHIKQHKNTLILQLKHFDGKLKGWEAQDDTVDFKLVKLEKDIVYFEGLTMEKTTTDVLKVYVLVEEESEQRELLFTYTNYQQ